MQLTTIEKIRGNSQKTIKSTWFLVVMCALVVGIFIYKMVDISKTPLSNLDGIHGHVSYWSEYLRQTIQSLGSVSILLGITLIARHTRKFGKYALAGNFLILVNGALTGLWFEMIVRAIMFTLYALQVYNWNKRDDAGIGIDRATLKEALISFALILVVVVGIATPLHITGKAEVINMKAAIPDAFQGVLNIVGVWLIARRKTEGQLALVISNCFAIAMFIVVGQPVMIASTAAFLLVSLIAWIQWESMFAEAKQTNWMYFFKVKGHSYSWVDKSKTLKEPELEDKLSIVDQENFNKDLVNPIFEEMTETILRGDKKEIEHAIKEGRKIRERFLKNPKYKEMYGEADKEIKRFSKEYDEYKKKNLIDIEEKKDEVKKPSKSSKKSSKKK